MEIERLQYIATLIGEPARIQILWALMDGRAYTATELSVIADVSPQSASMHLSKLVQADLLKVTPQGRHRYYSFAKDDVAYVVESMANLIPQDKIITSKKIKDIPFRYCRSCYNHLAGKVGVGITDNLLRLDFLTEKDHTYEVTASGHIFFHELGIDTTKLSGNKRSIARPCLDWSERRPHLAGSVGTALLTKMVDDQWVRRVHHSRTFIVTSIGKQNLYDKLGLAL